MNNQMKGRLLGRQLARELSKEEIEKVSGGRAPWITWCGTYNENGQSDLEEDDMP